jgi:drug/metabolite transporter (DMT)-like permease
MLLWIVLAAGRHKIPPLRTLAPLFVVALLNNALPFCLFAWGERTVPSSIAGILNATTPIWALLIGLATGGARATRLTAAGVVLGFLGVLGVVYGHSSGIAAASGSGGFLLGALAISIATLSYGAGAVSAKRWLQGVQPVVIATLQLSLAGLALLPIALIGPHPTALHFKSVAAIIVLGVLGTGLAYLIFFRLLATISPTRTVAVTYVLPIWGLFWGFLAGEQIHWTALAGVAVVLAGLLLLNVRTQPKQAAAPDQPTTATVSAQEPCPAEQS